MHLLIIIRSCLVFFILFVPFVSMAKENVILAYYNETPPWQTNVDGLNGLSYELASFLNSDKNSTFHFVAEFIVRNRINQILEKGNEPIVVAWVHPAFFDDENKSKYYWSKPLISDSQLILSSAKNPLLFYNLNSLKGKVFSAVAGLRYRTLEPFIKSSEIKRVDSIRYVTAIENVLSANKGLDFCIIENTTLNFFKNIDKTIINLNRSYISKKPLTPLYKRSLLIPLNNKKLNHYLEKRLKSIDKDKEWKKILKKYGQ